MDDATIRRPRAARLRVLVAAAAAALLALVAFGLPTSAGAQTDSEPMTQEQKEARRAEHRAEHGLEGRPANRDEAAQRMQARLKEHDGECDEATRAAHAERREQRMAEARAGRRGPSTPSA